MPDVLWSRSFDGASPRILLGWNQVLLDYTPGSSKVWDLTGPRKLICFDLEGQILWGHSGLRGLLSLPGNRFLVADRRGIPRILDGDGCEVTRWTGKRKIDHAERHDNLVVMRAGPAVYVTDLDLEPLNKLELLEKSRSGVDCLVDGSFRWVEGNEIWRQSVFGEPEPFAPIPVGMVEETLSQYRVGNKSSRLGYEWHISFDEDDEVFFLANGGPPHILVCLDRQGNANWCRFISPMCCGGVGFRLPSGLYVTSSGCGAVLTWFDIHGHLLFRSDPPRPKGVFAYWNTVTVLSDGRSLVKGSPGIDAYDSSAGFLWRIERIYSEFEACEESGLLFVCTQPKGKPAVLEAFTNL